MSVCQRGDERYADGMRQRVSAVSMLHLRAVCFNLALSLGLWRNRGTTEYSYRLTRLKEPELQCWLCFSHSLWRGWNVYLIPASCGSAGGIFVLTAATCSSSSLAAGVCRNMERTVKNPVASCREDLLTTSLHKHFLSHMTSCVGFPPRIESEGEAGEGQTAYSCFNGSLNSK